MLTDTAIRKAKPIDKAYKLSDSGGLYLLIKPNGARYWRMKYRHAGKEKLLSFGVYPAISLADARERREQARRLIANDIDPGEAKRAAKEEKAQQGIMVVDTFKRVACDWMAWRSARGETATTTANKDRWRLESYLFPYIGHRPIAEITPLELRDVLKKAEDAGKRETASRVKITAGQVFRWAMLEGRAQADITASLRGLFTTPKPTHRATITEPVRIGELLRAIDAFSGQFVTLCALRLAPLVFVRPGELRKAEWQEIDLEGAVWRIPGERMKMKAPHVVPLSTQAVGILGELHGLTGIGRYVFPSIRTLTRPMSENTVNAALRRLGYAKDEMTGHGFRSMAASRLNELGWNPDAIERQLAHAELNKVRAAYTHAAHYLEERKRMMQAWANYLDELRNGASIVSFHRKAGQRA